MMKNLLFIKWKLLLIFLLECKPAFQSIAGVTYMDDFDFEERYANVKECDPFYWHPLHLPEYCADMFEKIIRSRMGQHAPFRIVKPRSGTRQKHEVYSLHVPSASQEVSNQFELDQDFVKDEPMEFNQEFEWNLNRDVNIESLSPYEKMINILRQDLESHSAAPTIGYVPNIGQVAVYRQPISKTSHKIIKELTKAYKKFSQSSRKSEINKIVINPTTLEKIKKKKKHLHHGKIKTKT